MNQEKLFKEIMTELKSTGILMVTDSVLPSVAAIVAGERVRGSWWGHPKSHDIFAINVTLTEHPDVLVTKRVAGKTTFVHRQLWSALYQIATANDQWQLDGLSEVARKLLSEVSKSGQMRIDQSAATLNINPKTISKAATELETKLLAHGDQIHTETGTHLKLLESWEHWADRVKLSMEPMATEEAKHKFGHILERLMPGSAVLPWMMKRTKKTSAKPDAK